MASAIKRECSLLTHISELVGRFTAITTVNHQEGSSENNTAVNEILDQFNSLQLDDPASPASCCATHIERFIEHCCLHITADSGQLGIRCCIVVTNLIIKSEVELSDNVISELLRFLHNYISSYDQWAHADILKTLGAVLYCRGGRLSSQQLDDLVTVETGLLYKVIFDPTTDSYTRKEALRCVENLCKRCFPYIDDYYASLSLNIFLSVLKTKFPKTDEFLQCKLLMAALKGIHQVISNTKTAHGSLLGEILAALKAYNFFGRDDPSVQIPSCLHPTHMGEDVPPSLIHPAAPRRPPKKTLKKKSRARRQRREEQDSDGDEGGGHMRSMDTLLWHRLSGSESDYSDTETGGQFTKLQGCQARVRQCSLAALYTVLKGTVKRLIFGYWTSFLPTSSDKKAGTLVALLDSEWSIRVKVAALAAIAAFLDRSKSTLLLATERESSSTTPFTPFSVLLGDMIKDLHISLINLLCAESSPHAITSVIKCLAMLVANSPYQKLKPGLLSRTVRLVRPYLSHRDVNVKVAALTCMGSAVTVHAPLLEVVHLFLPSARQEEEADQDFMASGEENSQSSAGVSKPSTPSMLTNTPSKSAAALAGRAGKDSNLWLVKTCGRCIHVSSPAVVIPLPLRLEALQVLSSLALGYLTVLRSSLEYLTNILVQSLTDSDPSVQLHAAKTSDSIAVAFSRHFANKTDDSNDETLTTEEALTFWNTLLSGPLVTALQSETNAQLRAKCSDCLANIGAKVFESVQTSKQIICITMLLGLSADPEPLVRESAARALGVYVLFPCQRTDVSFVADVANAVITSLEDEALPVRVQSAWSLANVTEALVLNMACEDFESFASTLSDVLLLRLYDAATHASHQEDKIRYNGVRALGSLLHYTQLSTLQRRSMSHIIDNSVRILVQSLGQGAMKVRWNACYALGGLLQNDHVTVPSASWLEQVHTALCLAMKNSKNFKVRINASQALQTARQRVKYGPAGLFTSTWKYVIEAIGEADKTEDFTNYKYMSSLSQQLRKTVLHLTSLTESDDLLCLGAVLFSKEDTIKQFLNDSAEPLDREGCITHLRELESEELGAERSLVLSTLLLIVTPPANDEEEDQAGLKTTFRPSYD